MPLTITGDLITSDRTTHTARLVPARPHAGHVTRLPGRLGNQTIELGQAAPQETPIATRPPETTIAREPAVSPAAREATGP
jgi:hypothetical protein